MFICFHLLTFPVFLCIYVFVCLRCAPFRYCIFYDSYVFLHLCSFFRFLPTGEIGEKPGFTFFTQAFEGVFTGPRQGFHQVFTGKIQGRTCPFGASTYTGWLRTVLGSWTLWGDMRNAGAPKWCTLYTAHAYVHMRTGL